MAKFRTNHSKQSKTNAGGNIVKVGLFAAIVGGLFYIFNLFTGNVPPADDPTVDQEKEYINEEYDEGRYYLPGGTDGQIIRHKYYTLSYSEEHEQAEWVAYVLTRERLSVPWVQRVDDFMPDPKVRTQSATPDDYRGSGYDRGHLVPVADRSFSEEAMQETFYMSNISPQSRNFNQGIWRELEELTRNWAKKFKKLYVVTGPVLTQRPKGRVGDNGVSIPQSYYKVLLDLSEPEIKAIAFLLPNQVNYDPLYEFAVSIDEVEELTGIDFFSELLDDNEEEELESSFNIDLWQFSKKKYDLRVKQWNNR
jgi:endonuclease G